MTTETDVAMVTARYEYQTVKGIECIQVSAYNPKIGDFDIYQSYYGNDAFTKVNITSCIPGDTIEFIKEGEIYKYIKNLSHEKRKLNFSKFYMEKHYSK